MWQKARQLLATKNNLLDGFKIVNENDSSRTSKDKIRINVLLSDQIFSVNISPDAKVSDVKKQVAEESQINVNHITMKLESTVLKDEKYLRNYEIKDNSTLTMTATITVLVKYLERIISLQISSEATVSELKEQISSNKRIDVEDYELLFEGKKLNDQERLYKYNIRHYSTVIIIIIIKLILKFFNESREMEVAKNTTVANVKKKLSEIIKIDINNITLRFNLIFLHDDETLTQCQIEDNSVLLMRIQMRIFVDYCGESHEIESSSENTIDNIKTQLSERTGIGIEFIHLYLNGQEMKNEDLLGQYGIQERLELVMRVRMTVMIQFCDKDYNIETFSDERILDLKRKLCEGFNKDLNRIILHFKNQTLNNDIMINYYEIKDKSVIFMKIPMKVFVNYCGESHEIESSSENTIDNIKTQLSMKTEIGIGFIHLYLNGKEMKNEDLLGQYGIQERLELVMRVRMTIVIQFCDKDYNIEIFSDETILNLKRKVHRRFQKEMNEIILYFNNQSLDVDRTVKDYEIKDNSRLIMKTTIKLVINFCDKSDNIETYSDATIGDIKSHCAKEYKIKERQIFLWMKEKRVDDVNKKIYEYNVQKNSIIKMRENVKINIIFNNITYNFELFSDEKVLDLVTKLSERMNIEKDSIQLLFDKIFLVNNKLLCKYNLRDSKLMLIIKLKINVTFGEDKYQLEYLSNAKVKEVKQELSEKCKIDSKNIYLEISNKEMNEEDELGIFRGRSLNISMSKIIQLFCKYLGKNYTIDIPLIFTVNKLKVIIQNKLRIDGALVLSFGGNILEEDKTIQYYKITENSTIFTVSLLKGGYDL